MLYRRDGKSNKDLSALGFGCMRFPAKGGGIDFDRASAMLNNAIDRGVNYLDTAYIYGGSEAFLGQVLTPELRDRVNVATKLPLFLVRGKGDFDKYFDRSLERLKTDRVEYYLMHMLATLDVWEKLRGWGAEEWIAEQKRRGRIGAIGFSYHGGRLEFPKILQAYPWDFCMIQYNYLDEYNQAGRSGLELAESLGIPVMVMEPLRGGSLVRELPESAVKAFAEYDPNRPLAEWALRWVLNHKGVTCVLSGMSSERDVEENLRVASDCKPNSLTEEELAVYGRVTEILNAAVRVPCTACGYCLPCPQGVDIPTCFASYNMVTAKSRGTAIRRYMQNISALNTDRHYASKCTGCGKCEKHCPQGIRIREELAKTAKTLEPWWFKFGMSVGRWFAGNRVKKQC